MGNVYYQLLADNEIIEMTIWSQTVVIDLSAASTPSDTVAGSVHL